MIAVFLHLADTIGGVYRVFGCGDQGERIDQSLRPVSLRRDEQTAPIIVDVRDRTLISGGKTIQAETAAFDETSQSDVKPHRLVAGPTHGGQLSIGCVQGVTLTGLKRTAYAGKEDVLHRIGFIQGDSHGHRLEITFRLRDNLQGLDLFHLKITGADVNDTDELTGFGSAFAGQQVRRVIHERRAVGHDDLPVGRRQHHQLHFTIRSPPGGTPFRVTRRTSRMAQEAISVARRR